MLDLRSRMTPDLIVRYDRPGPRYTSYPTAPHMRPEVGAPRYAEALLRADATRPLSLYFHLPFCKSLCYYCGCHMMVTNRPEKIEEYVDYLIREIEMMAELASPDRIVTHIHWGGGTPTFLSPRQMERLIGEIRGRFRISPDAEIGIEADPRTLTREHLEVAREGGFNRISLGVQDLDEGVQQAIGRIQPESMVRQSVNDSRAAGIERIALDLIYGLPHQSRATWEHTLDRVINLAPDRLSVFSYAHVPWLKKHQRAIPTAALPSPEAKMDLFLTAIERLTDSGYRHVGMDHFAHPDDPLCVAQDEGRLHRNFQGYATDAGCDLLGLGLSSISQLDRMYVQNEKGLRGYYERLDRSELPTTRGVELTYDDVIRRHVIMRLMCDFAVSRVDVSTRFDLDFDEYFDAALSRLPDLEDHGLITDDGVEIRATSIGRLLIRNVAMEFDAYLTRGEGASVGFSQTV